jgi:group II intron reverse transcriptase/maturase
MRYSITSHPNCYRRVFMNSKKNAAAGIDKVTWCDYEMLIGKGRLESLHHEIQSGTYRAKPSRRVYIAKADGKQRPLGIAAIEDKVVQQAVVTVLNCNYEVDFLGFSYGFRQGRNPHNALDALSEGINGRKVNWILDADIRSFFDEIDHEWMIRLLEHRIADRRMVKLIRKWLIVGIIDDKGNRMAANKGTPQGAVISPLLANIYLHYALDLWVNQWRKRYAIGDMIVVRYADDVVWGFQYEREANLFLHYLRERMVKFKLELHPDKTRLIRFGRYAEMQCKEHGLKKPNTFDFLGFTHICGQTRTTGKFKLLRLTVKKRMKATLKAIRDKLYKRRHEPIPIIGKWLSKVVRGYLNYYAVPGNLRRR